MLFAKPLREVTQHENVGTRAADLVFLRTHQFTTPDAFLIQSSAFDEVFRINNIKYKIDYILSHAQEHIPNTLLNAYNSVRKALMEAQLPAGFETEVRELFERMTAPLAIGELVATNERLPVRIILSTNRIDDPENNDTIIQNIHGIEELFLAIREAWALAYHPTQLKARLVDHFPESKLKVALIVQVMDTPVTNCHAYSSLPQDHHKVYLQLYDGYTDLRDKIGKDYYAIAKNDMNIVAKQIHPTPTKLSLKEHELVVVPLKSVAEKLAERDLYELARQTKRAESLLKTPVKLFFAMHENVYDVLWANRLGFDVLIADEPEPPSAQPTSLPIAAPSAQQLIEQADDFLFDQAQVEKEPVASPAQEHATEAPTPVQATAPSAQTDISHVSAKLLRASLNLVRQVVERKFRSTFSESTTLESLAEMINRLNQANVFSRNVDGALLLQAEEAAKNEGTLTNVEYAKAIGEVAFILSYA